MDTALFCFCADLAAYQHKIRTGPLKSTKDSLDYTHSGRAHGIPELSVRKLYLMAVSLVFAEIT